MPSQAPVVTVGMPVYNGASFLRQALDSLLAQTYADFELIVSDNASTDATEVICREYAERDRRVRYVRQERNIGAPRNWNFVARHARGRYLKWASANDYCAPELLAACLQVLQGDARAVLCYGTAMLVDEASGAARAYDGDIAIAEDRPSERLARLADMKLNNAISGLIRMDVLRRTRLIRLYPGGDFVLMAELAIAGAFVLLPQALLFRRIGTRSFSGYLRKTDKKQFFDPQARFAPTLAWLRRDLDYVATVLRACMPAGEKGAALARAVRMTYWDLRYRMTPR